MKGLVDNGFWVLKNIENTIIFNFNKLMIYAKLTAAEAAAMIQNDETVALSGFTPNGVAKAVFLANSLSGPCTNMPHDAPLRLESSREPLRVRV